MVKNLPFMEVDAFFNEIKNGRISNLYLFYGAEGYYLEGSIKQVLDAIVPPDSEVFNLAKFSGDKLSLDELSGALEQFPMMSEYKCVLIPDFSLSSLKADQLKTLLGLIKNIPETAVLILAMEPGEVNLKKDTKLKSFAQNVSKFGTVVNFSNLPVSFIKRSLAGTAKKRGITLRNDAADLLIKKCGASFVPLLNELEKQINYCMTSKDKTITTESVNELTVKTTEESVFALGKLILAENAEAAYDLLHQLLLQRIPEINIISVLSSVYVDLYRADCAKKEGKTYSDTAKEFGYWGKEFLLRNAYHDTVKFNELQLSRALKILLEADTALKSSRAENKIILQKTITRLLTNV
ncbi:MAG: DNA polymerase III subunit delta [Oscillospiraceae bacterium]|nr:DNA polymerase III subunit delta [Oscillospiraceae bacterium]